MALNDQFYMYCLAGGVCKSTCVPIIWVRTINLFVYLLNALRQTRIANLCSSLFAKRQPISVYMKIPKSVC